MFVCDWNKPDHWLGTTSNYDLFPATSFFDEARQLSLRFVNSKGFHIS